MNKLWGIKLRKETKRVEEWKKGSQTTEIYGCGIFALDSESGILRSEVVAHKEFKFTTKWQKTASNLQGEYNIWATFK